MMNDLTVGKPEAVLWKFCMPLFGSIVFQQLYNIADSFVAGKFIGENALAAVGNSYEITLIFIAFAFGCNMGCSVIVSQFFGARRYENMKTAVYTAMITSAMICIVIMVCGLLFCDSLLGMINTPEELLGDSKIYLDIYILGLPFVFFIISQRESSQHWETPRHPLFSGSFIHIEYCCGYPVRYSFSYGSSRGSLGNFSVSGS